MSLTDQNQSRPSDQIEQPQFDSSEATGWQTTFVQDSQREQQQAALRADLRQGTNPTSQVDAVGNAFSAASAPRDTNVPDAIRGAFAGAPASRDTNVPDAIRNAFAGAPASRDTNVPDAIRNAFSGAPAPRNADVPDAVRHAFSGAPAPVNNEVPADAPRNPAAAGADARPRRRDEDAPTSIAPERMTLEQILAADRTTLSQEVIAQNIADLGSDSYRTRERAFRTLRNAGPEVLPQLVNAANGDGSLEQRRRSEQLLGHFRSDISRVADALGSSDQAVRNAAARIAPQTGSMLEAVTNSDLSFAQRNTLSNFMTSRNTMEELRELYGQSARKTGEPGDPVRQITQSRQALGYAMLFDRSTIADRSAHLGVQLALSGQNEEAAQRLEAGRHSNDPSTQVWSEGHLAAVRAQQNNPQAFMDSIQRLTRQVAAAEAGNPEASRLGFELAMRSFDAAAANPAFQQQHQAMAHLRAQVEASRQAFLVRHPNPLENKIRMGR